MLSSTKSKVLFGCNLSFFPVLKLRRALIMPFCVSQHVRVFFFFNHCPQRFKKQKLLQDGILSFSWTLFPLIFSLFGMTQSASSCFSLFSILNVWTCCMTHNFYPTCLLSVCTFHTFLFCLFSLIDDKNNWKKTIFVELILVLHSSVL